MSTATAAPEGFVRDRHWAFDFVLTAIVAVFTVAPYTGVGLGEAVLSMLLVLALFFRRAAPRLAVTLATIAAFTQAIYLHEPTGSIVVVPMLIYSIARWSSLNLARVALGLGFFGALVGPASWIFASNGGFYVDGLPAFTMTSLACGGIAVGGYLIGRRRSDQVERRTQEAAAAAEQQRLLWVEQQQRANMATVQERNRIARELHDIVAHSLSVIVVQAEGGKAMAARKPELAPEVLGTIAETSREALEEMRRMVGLLRSGPQHESDAYLPTPGLADIADLVRKTGDNASFTSHGTVPQVSQALGLTCYRVVQESLTNVLKHAGPAAKAQVSIGYFPSSIELEVTDDGRGSAAASDGLGHGLQGMHERVALHAGRLSAQPRPGGGFVVRASLPLEPTAGLSRSAGSWPGSAG